MYKIKPTIFTITKEEIEETVDLKNYATNGDTLKNILYEEFGITTDNVTVSGTSITTKIEPYSMKIFKK